MSEAALDPYVVLGVSPTASDLELRSAYRLLVKRHHPDLGDGSPESAARFAQVQEAYAILVRRHRVSERRHSAAWQHSAYEAVAAQQPEVAEEKIDLRPRGAAAPGHTGRARADEQRQHAVPPKREFARRLAELFTREA